MSNYLEELLRTDEFNSRFVGTKEKIVSVGIVQVYDGNQTFFQTKRYLYFDTFTLLLNLEYSIKSYNLNKRFDRFGEDATLKMRYNNKKKWKTLVYQDENDGPIFDEFNHNNKYINDLVNKIIQISVLFIGEDNTSGNQSEEIDHYRAHLTLTPAV